MKRKIEKFLGERQTRGGGRPAAQTSDGRLNIDNDIDGALAAVRGRDPFGSHDGMSGSGTGGGNRGAEGGRNSSGSSKNSSKSKNRTDLSAPVPTPR